jgi:two-component system NtrC family sensor kinase
VDDDEAVAGLICEALSTDGHRVAQAPSREDALRRLDRESFDLLLVDLKMPGMPDERFRQELERRRPELARRLLVMTGDTVGQSWQPTARSWGAEVLHKPFDVEDLLEAVRSRLREC